MAKNLNIKLVKSLNGRIAKHKVPRYVQFVKEFPMNAAGKILKYRMREQAVELLNLQAEAKIVTA